MSERMCINGNGPGVADVSLQVEIKTKEICKSKAVNYKRRETFDEERVQWNDAIQMSRMKNGKWQL